MKPNEIFILYGTFMEHDGPGNFVVIKYFCLFGMYAYFSRNLFFQKLHNYNNIIEISHSTANT